jgi:3-oxoacyl-[acyl-carrier-protein] synthase III
MGRLRARIAAVKSYLPNLEITNDALVRHPSKWTAGSIYEKTGVVSRRICDTHECASDLGVAAALRLFEADIVTPDAIDFLLFCTQTPDYFLPATACLVQERLGLRRTCGALDFSLGCSGFVYGLSLAKGLVETGLAANVLLITADTYTKFLNPTDLAVRTIFGDGAAATLISVTEGKEELVGPFLFGTDGRGAKHLIVPAGAMRIPPTADTDNEMEVEPGVFRSERNLFMNGPEIFSFTLRTVPRMVRELLAQSGLDMEAVDYFVFHQASKLILDHLRKKMGIPDQKFAVSLETCGNTVSSTMPIAMESALERGILVENSKIMLVGFGVGYSWAAAMIRFPRREG